MKMLLFLPLLLMGCYRAPLVTETTNNPDFHVETLFTKNGCTVYRFSDGTYPHYFADCQGAVLSRIQTGRTSRTDDIETEK